MKYFTLLLIVFLSFFNKSIAQNAAPSINSVRDLTNLSDYLYQSKKGIPQDVIGAPYINIHNTTININKESLQGRYNAYLDYFEVEKKGQIKYALPEDNLYSTIKVGPENKEYKALRLNSKDCAFFKVIAKGEKEILLEQNKIALIPGKKAQENYGIPTTAEFKRKRDIIYIYNIQTKELTKLSKSRKKTEKLFIKKNKNLKAYIKNNKINLKNKKDLIKLFNHYSNL